MTTYGSHKMASIVKMYYSNRWKIHLNMVFLEDQLIAWDKKVKVLIMVIKIRGTSPKLTILMV